MLTVYTKSLCPYCVRAKQYLDIHKIPYETINIEEDSQAWDFISSAGHRTVPQIYHNGKLFVEGGCDSLVKLGAQEIRERMGDLDLGNLSL